MKQRSPALDALVWDVNDQLNCYIAAHDAVFKTSWRNVVPIPGIFRPIPFGELAKDLAEVCSSLAELRQRAASAKILPDESGARAAAESYLHHLLATAEQLKAICEKNAGVALGTGRYAMDDYNADVAEYQARVARYSAAGRGLNQALEIL
jgi:hypothetical protein